MSKADKVLKQFDNAIFYARKKNNEAKVADLEFEREHYQLQQKLLNGLWKQILDSVHPNIKRYSGRTWREVLEADENRAILDLLNKF